MLKVDENLASLAELMGQPALSLLPWKPHEGTLRMQISTFNFPTGQALLDWLRANKLPFEQHRVTQ